MAGGYFNSRSMEDYPMAPTISPILRSTVGFDRFLQPARSGDLGRQPGYPPYNIERTGETLTASALRSPDSRKASFSIVAKKTR